LLIYRFGLFLKIQRRWQIKSLRAQHLAQHAYQALALCNGRFGIQSVGGSKAWVRSILHGARIALCSGFGIQSVGGSRACVRSILHRAQINEPACVTAYFNEFRTLLMLSEPLTSRARRPTYK
jgi:hypothetical protein